MDKETLRAYNSAAAEFSKEWGDQPAPDDLYDLLVQYFKPGLTADIGCGSGRDAAWLAAHGYAVHGYDASEELLREAKSSYPHLHWDVATLPALENIPQNTVENVLCETVIMHLAPDTITQAVQRLRDILFPGGTLYLSWRVTENNLQRDKHGRLYAAFDKDLVLNALNEHDSVLLDREDISASSGKKIHRLIVRKAE